MSIDRTWYNTLVDNSSPTAADGTIWNKAAVDALMDAIDAALGTFVDVPFNAANFTGGAGVWTLEAGDVIINRYKVVDKVMTWWVQIGTASVGGATPVLRIAAPAGISFATTATFSAAAIPAGAFVSPLTDALLGISYPGGANWPVNTHGTYLYFTFVGQVT